MSKKCFFSDFDAEVTPIREFDGVAFRCPMVDEYFLSGHAMAAYDGQLSSKQKFLCLQETIKLNDQKLIPVWVVDNSDMQQPLWQNVVIRKISDFKEKEISHKEKQHDILEMLGKKASRLINPFDFVNLLERERISIGIFSGIEYFHWIASLNDQELIEYTDEAKALSKSNVLGQSASERMEKYLKSENVVRLTSKGWTKLYSDKTLLNTRNVFIAMAFTDEEGVVLPVEHRDCIRKVLEELDWSPVIVDEVPHNDGVMDKIVMSINNSRFIIADLTYHKNGVYFEAGYGKGLGLPVILTVKEDHLKNSHFDVQHLNLVVWKDYGELKEKLANRIRATIKK